MTSTDLSKRLREVTGLRSFAELFGFSWTDGNDWDWHDVACAMADTIDATAGTAMTLDQATERIEKFMGDYAKVLLESTLYVERDEPTDQHAFCVAERKEAQMARDLAEALATVGVGTCHMRLAYEEEDADGCIWPDHYECDACGAKVNGIMPFYDTEIPPKVCSNCGRKVVSE